MTQAYRIFISSPSDVRAERDALEELIQNDLQQKLEQHFDIYLKPLRWEKLVTPGMGDIQSRVSRQMGKYDIFVGIFWKRFGTPTSSHESGSEQEFEEAYKLWEEDNSRPILMYFCTQPFMPDSQDELDQMGKVLSFRKKLDSKGLYSTYKGSDDFKDQVSRHLYKTIVDLNPPAKDEKALNKTQIQSKTASNPKARRNYLQHLCRECRVLPLAQLGGKANRVRPVTLNDVYITLSTKTPKDKDQHIKKEEEEIRYLTAQEAANQTPFMALLGGPGSGKSTFVKQLIANLSQTELDGDAGLLPVLINLRDLAPRLARAKLDGLVDDKRRWPLAAVVFEQVVHDLGVLQVPEAEGVVQEAFASGDLCLVLDGLDEVPYDLRSLVREAVGAVLQCHEPKKVIVTCRIRSYSGASELDGFIAHILAPFSESQVNNFIAGWYNAQVDLNALQMAEAKRLTDDLQKAVKTGYLKPLAENPMLMTTMIMVHQEETELPRQRVMLYEKAVEILIRKWQQGKGKLPADLDDLLGSKERIRPIIQRLAYEAHSKNATDTDADLPRLEALGILEMPEYLDKMAFAERFLDYVDEKAGLLVGRGGSPGKPATYSFPHRTFQEYLAGCYLINNPRSAVREIRKLAAAGDFWSVAVQLGAQELLYNRENSYQLLDYAKKLLPNEVTDKTTARQALWSGHMAQVVGREAVERDEETGQVYLDKLGHALVKTLGTDLPPVERAEAGRLLGELGDPRKELLTLETIPFCYVPAGPFLMGDPGKETKVTEPYWISQYPVTQMQYRFFVEAGGYDNKLWWTNAGWEIKEKNGWNDRRTHGEPYDLPNHPVVGVSWYEAQAFTSWLTAHLQGEKLLPKDTKIVLPTEMQWEKAARGGLKVPETPLISSPGGLKTENQLIQKTNPLPGRKYPWGEEIDGDYCNYNGTGIGTTSTPGAFTRGQSPYGVHEMSGNVDEWTRSKWSGGEETEGSNVRVLRGGSFGDNVGFVRCARRVNFGPDGRGWFWGFRLVSLPLK